MAVKNIAPGDNGEPWLYVQTAVENGHSVMFCRDTAAWQDIQRVAQNEADQTGKAQYLVAYPGTGHRVTHMVTPEPGRHRALGSH